MVIIPSPPPHRTPKPKFFIWRQGEPLFRIYDPTSHSTAPLTFRHYGPLKRFDHHRGVVPGIDSDRGILYAAPTLSGCIVEVFGDDGVIMLANRFLVSLNAKRDIRLLDLTGRNAMTVGCVVAISAIADYDKSQAWSRYFYETSDYFENLDGLIYRNAHNGEKALALYERCESSLTFTPGLAIPLNGDPRLVTKIRMIAKRHNMLIP